MRLTKWTRKFFCGLAVVFIAIPASSQRTYKANSVLADGTWYKLAVNKEGIYKIDLSFLNSLGVNTINLASSSIRIFGNGGFMLEESMAGTWVDDLQENPLLVFDGGDGILNQGDQVVFYAPGPHKWLPDSLNKGFIHQQNIYSDTSYYFFIIGGTGKRINSQVPAPAPSATVTSYNERYFHELDSVNLLSSGKEWFGEEFTSAPGKTLSRTFQVSLPGLQVNQQSRLIHNLVARSVGGSSRFDISINAVPLQQVTIPAAGAGIYDLFVQQVHQGADFISNQENLAINFTYVPGTFNSQGWLNFFEIQARRSLSLYQGQSGFRDWNSVGLGSAEFLLTNTTGNTEVWEITNPLEPVRMQVVHTGSETRFVNDCMRLREYFAFNPSDAMVPASGRRITNQDLHAGTTADYIIVTPELLIPEAERLAQFHRQKNNLRVLVTSTEKIFNEFASGSPDITAIRDFVKMFYDRATTQADKPKYLLLFGDASFDYKNRISNNFNLVPPYESRISIDPLSTYTSDDFFGYLDDNEDINSGLVVNLLDIGIGRVPAKNLEEARNYVNKVLDYYSAESLGPWRTNLSFVADDEDQNLHIEDAEIVSGTSASTNPLFNINKTYLDAFVQQSTAGIPRYPQVNEAINNRILNGVLIWNYNGHGGARRLAEEVILDQPIVNNWKNRYRLPLIVTATCDFAPYDVPYVSSLGENLLVRPMNGSIALMTTTRLVFSFSNRVMNENYMKAALEPDAGGNYKTLGEAVMAAKNHTYQTSGDIINNRKFTLLGDPALKLGFPSFKIKTTKVNDVQPPQTDTLSAGDISVIEGELVDHAGNPMNNFNGTLYPVIYDKPQTVQTLGNDPGSPITSFQAWATILFRGKASVNNGKFRFEFKVPRDIFFQYGNGRISYYAEDGSQDGSDVFTGFIVGGSSTVVENDKEGPLIKAWLNDERFVNGSIVNQSPILLLKLFDSSGINTTGTGVGHDITVTIDNDNNKFFVLNDYYEADLDNYRQGMVRFQLPSFEPGIHSLKIKAWDAVNNSSEIILDLHVVIDEELVINRVLNYPNPFTTRTQFWFEHNKPGQDLFIQIHIYSLTGKLIKRLSKTINTEGNRSSELEWDARDEYGDRVARGVYIYRITIQSPGSKPKTIIEKLVIL